MLYFHRHPNGAPMTITEDSSAGNRDATCRCDLKTFAEAAALADEYNAAFPPGQGRLIPTDEGAHTWPRYDVIRAPHIGAKVSRAFNGDYYPAGIVVCMSASLRRIVTSTGVVFYRRRGSSQWLADGMWGMAAGWRDERNPHL